MAVDYLDGGVLAPVIADCCDDGGSDDLLAFATAAKLRWKT